MAQFTGLLPSFEYSTGSPQPVLEFTIPPIRQLIYSKATTLESWAPEADTSSTTEYESNHIYVFDFVDIVCQGIIDSELDDFITWWEFVRDGSQFVYIPDKDDDGSPITSYNVVKAMNNFLPVRSNGLWSFTLTFRIIAA